MSLKKGKTLICCVGNPLNGDDGIGRAVADELRTHPMSGGVQIMDCGSEPHRYSNEIFRARPQKVIIITSLDIGMPAGATEILDTKSARSLLLSRHRPKLEMLLGYVEGFVEDVRFIAVQPKSVRPGRGLSPECRNAVRKAKEAALSLVS